MLRDLPRVTLSVGGKHTAEAETVENLGVLFDRHFSFETHVDEIIRPAMAC